MNRSGDVIIVGGGVIGLTTAYFLAKEGVRVVLCDQGRTGMEASWAGAGILPPSDLEHAQLPLDRLRAISGRLFPDLSADLFERTGIDNGFLRCGGLEFVSHLHDAAAHEWYGRGVHTEVLSEDDWTKFEPALARGLGNAIHVPSMAQLRNPWHLRALRAACLSTSLVTIHESTSVRAIVATGNRAKGIDTGNEVFYGDQFVVTAGAWTGRLLEPLVCRLRIEPVRGQIALLNTGAPLLRRVIAWGAQYLVPRADGRMLVGSTEEHAGFEKNNTAAGIRGLLDLAVRLAPRLAEATLEKTWAGLRPGSPDGLPFIGPAPGIDNLLVAAGHFRAGIQLSPGTALLLKEKILGQPATMPLEAFRLDR